MILNNTICKHIIVINQGDEILYVFIGTDDSNLVTHNIKKAHLFESEVEAFKIIDSSQDFWKESFGINNEAIIEIRKVYKFNK